MSTYILSLGYTNDGFRFCYPARYPLEIPRNQLDNTASNILNALQPPPKTDSLASHRGRGRVRWLPSSVGVIFTYNAQRSFLWWMWVIPPLRFNEKVMNNVETKANTHFANNAVASTVKKVLVVGDETALPWFIYSSWSGWDTLPLA